MGIGKRRRQHPPIDLVEFFRQQDESIRMSALHDYSWHDSPAVRIRGTLNVLHNRPIPRLASCHFFDVDRDRKNVYFY